MATKNDSQLNSIIGEGSIFKGKFYINGSLQVDGRFEGEIKTKDQLIVGELGKIKTDIVAKRVVVGGTVIGNIEALPHSILLWRSMIQWLGGMGIILFSIAILPLLGIGGMQLYKAEVPGPVVEKLKPRIAETARWRHPQP